jgi:protein SCO1/2
MQNLPQTTAINKRRSFFRQRRVMGAGLVLAVLMAVALGYWAYHQARPMPPDPPGVQTLEEPVPVPAFTLVDHRGQPFTQERLRGKWTLMFFGYTHCPDVCPTTLAALNSAYHTLEQQDPGLLTRTQFVFVSVDPFRDSPAVLSSFVTYFNPQFIGLTGTPVELQRLTGPMGMSYSYVDPATGEPVGATTQRPQHNYQVDHGASFYVFDERARIVAWVMPPHTGERIFSMFEHIRRQYE